MAWNRKYWDIQDQLYWSPQYLGLRSIPQGMWIASGDRISIPRELVSPDGPLYTRQRKARALREHLHSQEEILNHVFNLTFGIAPDALVRDVLVEPLGFADTGSFDSVGREVRYRYRWGEHTNVMQHDGLFVSGESALAVELKLRSQSSPEQIAKYAALLTWEELHSGRKRHVGLLFILPENALGGHWQKCGLDGPRIGGRFFGLAKTMKLPRLVADLFASEADAVRSVLNRMMLAAISWRDLRSRLQAIQDRLDPTQAGDQTLQRLIAGFLAQLEAHRHTGLSVSR